jgi:hypothetical protein
MFSYFAIVQGYSLNCLAEFFVEEEPLIGRELRMQLPLCYEGIPFQTYHLLAALSSCIEDTFD